MRSAAGTFGKIGSPLGIGPCDGDFRERFLGDEIDGNELRGARCQFDVMSLQLCRGDGLPSTESQRQWPTARP